MSRGGKIAIAVIVLALVVCIYLFWPAITGAINGNKYYTANDVQNAYNQGYDNGVGDKSQYEQLINSYKEKIQGLNLTIAKMDKTITDLRDTIAKKDAKIKELEKQIEELLPYKDKVQELNELIDKLDKTIKAQEKTIKYYEDRISDLEDDDTIFITFEANNSVYSVEKIARGAKVTTIVNPTSSDRVRFAGWLLDGVLIDVNTYIFNSSVKLVAQFDYAHSVRFMVDGACYNEQLVIEGNSATLPDTPTLTDDGAYTFVGWMLDGVVIDATTPVTADVEYVAQFERNTTSLDTSSFVQLGTNEVKKSVNAIVFDYYSNYNNYVIDGVNVINNITPAFSVNGVSCYLVTNTVYVLSNYNVRTTNISFSGYTALESIAFNNLIVDTTTMGFMFQNCSSLTSLDLSKFDTSKVTNMESMFEGCSSLTSLNLNNFDTSNVTNMMSMFAFCSGLTSLDLSKFNTSNVTNMSGMFQNCSNLTSLDLSGFDTSKVTNMSFMFANCDGLTSLDLSKFNTSSVTNMNGMFMDCANLRTIYVHQFVVATYTNEMFGGCASLRGKISYDADKTSGKYATIDGYLTYKEV